MKINILIRKYFTWFFAVVVFIVINLVAFPFITGDIMSDFEDSIMLSNQVEVPVYYKEASNYLGGHKKIFRAYTFPMQYLYNSVYLWDYMGPDPLARYLPDKYFATFFKTEQNSIQKMLYSLNGDDNFFDIFTKLSPMFNIKNIVLENDADWTFYRNVDSPESVKNKLDVRSDIFIKKVFGQLDIYEISDKYFLPIFYTTKNIIVSPQDVGVLPEIVSQEDYNLRSAIYLNQENPNVYSRLLNGNFIFNIPFNNSDENKKESHLVLDKHQSDSMFVLEKINNRDFLIDIQYFSGTGKLSVGGQLADDIFINSEKVDMPTEPLLEIPSQVGNFLKIGEYYFGVQSGYSKIFKLSEIKAGIEISQARVVNNFRLLGDSFEEGLWQETPGDCTDGMKGQADFSMSIFKDATHGYYSLELGSKNHFACVKKTFEVNLKKDKFYKYSFDFRSVGGNKLSYYYRLVGVDKKYSFGESITASNREWNHYETIIKPEEDINKITLYFYAPSDGTEEIINRYDNIELFEVNLNLVDTYEINENKLKDNKVEVKLKNGENIIEYRGETESVGSLPTDFYNYYLKSNSQEIINTPILEFKKINPIKYRIVVHGATDNFPLVFSESFHDGWKSYLVDYKKESVNLNEADYRIFNGNEDDQANANELQEFVDKGYVSTLGDLEEKNIKHKTWEDNKEVFDYNEPYKIDFVSKNFQDTIQNDNLESGNFYETWFKKPLDDNQNHLMVNGYANSWTVNPNELCLNNVKCVKNADGSYDFELVIEFWPQRLFYIGLFISGMTLLGCLGYLGWGFVKRRKRKGEILT